MISIMGFNVVHIAGVFLIAVGVLAGLAKTVDFSKLMKKKPQDVAPTENDYLAKVAGLTPDSNVSLFAIVNGLTLQQAQNLVTFLEGYKK